MFTSSPPTAPSPNQLLEAYRASYNDLLSTGTIKPLIYPYHFLSAHLILLYLLIPHRRHPWLYRARWVVLAMVAVFEAKTLRDVRCMSMAISYAAGLMASWAVIWSTTIMIWNKPQWDFRRVERLDKGASGKEQNGYSRRQEMANNSKKQRLSREILTEREQSVDGDTSGTGYMNGTGTKYMRKDIRGRVANGSAASGFSLPEDISRELELSSPHEDAKKDIDRGVEKLKFYWQSYPEGNESFHERLDWVLDLLTNFRGPGWSWAVPSLPPLPPYITSSLENASSAPNKSSKNASKSSSETKSDEKYEMEANPTIRKYNIIKFCIGYFVLDILKTTMMHDPYFYLGPNSYAPPSHLPTTIANSPFLLRAYRSILSLTSVVASLELAFLLGPLFFNHLLGPSVLGLRGHDFMYPPIWGPFTPNVLDKGLAGLWGGWWHQTFRFVFSSPPSYFIKKGWIEKKSMAAKVVSLLVAFGISGILHFCASITQFGNTKPWRPSIFFMLQGVGILIEMTFGNLFASHTKSLPKSMRRIGNLLFAFTWLFYTSPFLIDDFAGGGVWLYEPIPISLARGLGFGTEGDGWWCWSVQHGNGIGVGWYKGLEGRWWESGLGIY